MSSFSNYLYILDILDVGLVQNFSHSVDCHVVLLMVSFALQNLFSFMKFDLLTLSLSDCDIGKHTRARRELASSSDYINKSCCLLCVRQEMARTCSCAWRLGPQLLVRLWEIVVPLACRDQQVGEPEYYTPTLLVVFLSVSWSTKKQGSSAAYSHCQKFHHAFFTIIKR